MPLSYVALNTVSQQLQEQNRLSTNLIDNREMNINNRDKAKPREWNESRT